ncbi:MAG: hypothetical protein Pars2KO_12140 [Parasphingorhabdus sp.]
MAGKSSISALDYQLGELKVTILEWVLTETGGEEAGTSVTVSATKILMDIKEIAALR